MDSSTSSAELALREVASLDCAMKRHKREREVSSYNWVPHHTNGSSLGLFTFHVVILCSRPMEVLQFKIQANSACSGTC